MAINSSNATRLRGRNIHTSAPSDGQVLTFDTTNGWQPETPSSSAWTVLADVNLSGGAAATLSSGAITAKTRLRITISYGGFSSTDIARLQFNGDTGANYNYANSLNGGVSVAATGQAGINLYTANSTSAWLIVLDAYVSANGTQVNGQASTTTTQVECSGANTSITSLTSVVLRGAGGNNLPADTRMIIEGAN
jgi:hypothetical protein